MDFSNKNVAIIGIGLEGKDVLRFLSKKGAKVTVFDQKQKEELDLVDVRSLRFDVRCGPDYLKGGLQGFHYIVRSPGVRPDLPQILDAVKGGAKITSATNIFFSLCPAPVIGITGTKGKGTTATLVYECLVKSLPAQAGGKSVYLAGNIGKPYLELLPLLKPDDFVILELSSFQLIDIERSPHIAVVLNITTDHLDWHKDREEYVAAKENIVRFQTQEDYAVLMKDYETPASFAQKTRAAVYWASVKEQARGAYVLHGKIVVNIDKEEEVGSVDKLLLRGRHNWENVAAATCASYLAGATVEGIKKGVFSFKGLPHRLELVGTHNGITFYNDSFATSPAPVLAAVASFTEPVILILGGSSKGLSYEEFGKELANRKHIKAVLIIGEVGPEIQKAMKEGGFTGKIVAGGKNMVEIVQNAAYHAQPGDVVLLSPAAASFDMFKDYKDRGEQFKKEVGRLSNRY